MIPALTQQRIGLVGQLVRNVREFLFGAPVPTQLPTRVTKAIAREQDLSEILVSLIQITAILTFAALYSLAPKAFPPDVPFEPVPVALAFYTVFTLWRLWMACRRRLAYWMLALSVVVDITVLMVTIWSFHLQYQAPPAIYLKAPTLMYVFILIALRTLRFEPTLVILGGLAASTGWLVLVGYALWADPDIELTRSYADYMMSYKILLGAEFDKIVSILMVTAILAVALHRARKLLYRAAVEQQAAADLSRFFAPEVAGQITQAEEHLVPGMAERREASILFIDLRGFTPISETQPPEETMRLLSEYQALTVDLVRQEGGSIDKFMGDGILASFGATRRSDSHARDAVRALERVIEAGRDWQRDREARGLPAPPVAAALATGPVMFGTVGDADRLEYTVIGDTVNLAAKLEKHAKVERVAGLMPAESLELARRQGLDPAPAWQRREAREVAGTAAPIDIVVLAE